MTDEQINAIIATSLGFIEEEPWLDGRKCWAHIDNPNVRHESIPDFCNDLNACHEFEKTLSDGDYNKYYRHLSTACLRDFENGTHFSADPISATARQRCEAYLRMLGKWIE